MTIAEALLHKNMYQLQGDVFLTNGITFICKLSIFDTTNNPSILLLNLSKRHIQLAKFANFHAISQDHCIHDQRAAKWQYRAE